MFSYLLDPRHLDQGWTPEYGAAVTGSAVPGDSSYNINKAVRLVLVTFDFSERAIEY